jgi:hypothetical protein
MSTPNKRIQRQKMKYYIPAGVLLILLGSILLIGSAFGGDCLAPPPIATEQNIRDAVLGHKTFTSGQLSDMDLNQDGQVDVADLVCLVTTQSPGTPVASFDQVSSTVREGGSAAGIQVNFSSRFVGDLTYTIDGSAGAGLDYNALSGTVAVDGVEVYIPVAVVDDNAVEANVETILLTLHYADGAGLGYVPGIFTDHCVYVHDNDAV